MTRSNSKQIEDSAIFAVEGALRTCHFLENYLSKNDKTPAWDGTVIVYRNTGGKKRDIIGNVPVQVKGTERFQCSELISFPCKVEDLRIYYGNGGCILFRVCIDPQTEKANIFYSCLHVVDLKKELDRIGQKKFVTLKLARFPQESPDEIARIFTEFVKDSQKQTSFIDKRTPSLEEIIKERDKYDAISFCVSGVGLTQGNIERYVISHGFYLYAKPKGVDVEIPIEKVVVTNMHRLVSGSVCVKGKEFYSSYDVIFESGSYHIQLGKGIDISLGSFGKDGRVSIRRTGTLNELIRDASCFEAMIKNREISINEKYIYFNEMNIDKQQEFEEWLRYWKEVKRTLDLLGVVEDLNLDQLTDKDNTFLTTLVNSVLYNRRVYFSGKEEQFVIGSVKLANLSILIIGERCEDGSYHVNNFFRCRKSVCLEVRDGKASSSLPASLFLTLDKEAFIHTSNMDYEAVGDEICALVPHPALKQFATQTMLNILSGYDQQIEKENKLLDLAGRICDWLLKYAENEEYQLSRLNRLQIEKRRRQLTTLELKELCELIDEQYPACIRCGAFLLLDDSYSAQKCFDELSNEEQEEFIKYPICSFGKLTLGEKNNG